MLFWRAPKVHFASGQAFASIDIEEGPQVWVGNVDIKVAFYVMGLPAELMQYFGLPYDVRAGDVGVAELNGVAIPPWQLITPVFSAIPTGLDTLASGVSCSPGRLGSPSQRHHGRERAFRPPPRTADRPADPNILNNPPVLWS